MGMHTHIWRDFEGALYYSVLSIFLVNVFVNQHTEEVPPMLSHSTADLIAEIRTPAISMKSSF